MSVLLHTCCAPCLVYPAKVLEEKNIEFSCYFYNPNIHPYREFKKRLDTFRLLADERKYNYIIDRDYGLKTFLRAVVFKEDLRCRHCYRMRLEQTVKLAVENDHDHFSTTLLYSVYQNHSLIIKQAETVSSTSSVDFMYRDFRPGWQQGIDESIQCNLYRQSYCGCIYSEQERYDNRLKKQLTRKRKNDVQSDRSRHNKPE